MISTSKCKEKMQLINLDDIEKIKILDKLGIGVDDIEIFEKILDQKIDQDPTNIDLWLRLAMLETTVPLVDAKKSIFV